LKKNAIAILYRRVKATKAEEVVVFKQAHGAGEFSMLDFQVNMDGTVTYNSTSRVYALTNTNDNAIARPWVTLLNSYPATSF
jgi:hypothetical protein